MSTKIYDAFIIKAKNPTSFPTLIDIAQSARCRMLDAFRDNFGKTVLIRLFKIVDLVAFYGDDILEMDKFKQLNDNNKELIQKWIKIKNTHPSNSDVERHLMLWYSAVDSMTTSLKELEKEYHQSNHKAKIMFIPCGRKTLGMFFGDCSYYDILFDDTENIVDYHYQNQTDKPDNISDAEWKRRAKDWDRAIGPDYIPLNHGMEFTLLDYSNIEEDMLMIKSGKYIYNKYFNDIASKRIVNILATVDPDKGMFPEMPDDMTPSECINIIKQVKSTTEYKEWKAKTKKEIADKLGIALQETT